MTGYELDLYNIEQLPAFKEKLTEMTKQNRRVEDKDLEKVKVAEKDVEAAEASVEKESGESVGHWGSLGKAVVNKLEKAGFKTLEDLKGKDKKALTGIEGIGAATADKILKEIG